MSVMSKLLKAIIPLVLFSVLAMFLLKGLKQNPHKVGSTFINKPLPGFTASSLEGPERQLTDAMFKNHVTLLNVFASWCLYCRSEHPVLMDIRDRSHITIYGLDYKDKRAAAMKWLKTYGNPYTKIIFDPKGELALNLGVYGTPETFIIDKEGIVRYKYVGPISQKIWKNKLLPIVMRLEKNS